MLLWMKKRSFFWWSGNRRNIIWSGSFCGFFVSCSSELEWQHNLLFLSTQKRSTRLFLKTCWCRWVTEISRWKLNASDDLNRESQNKQNPTGREKPQRISFHLRDKKQKPPASSLFKQTLYLSLTLRRFILKKSVLWTLVYLVINKVLLMIYQCGKLEVRFCSLK